MYRSTTALSSAAIAAAYSGGQREIDWAVNHYGGYDAVTFQPVACCRFRDKEGGMVVTNLANTLAPVSGELQSKANVQVLKIFVPYEAMNKLEYPDDPMAGITEVIKQRWSDGEAGIGLEPENDVSKSCYVHGEQTGAAIEVQKTVRLAYICAVNHMRLATYHRADLLDKDFEGLARATLGASVLQRFDGVLDPEPLSDGAINLTGELPVKGIYGHDATTGQTFANDDRFIDAEGDAIPEGVKTSHAHDASNLNAIRVERRDDGTVAVSADLSGAGEFTLRDLMEGRRMEQIIRGFAGIVKNDPVHGEEAVRRALFNMTMDVRDVPQVLFNETYQLTPQMHQPMDAAGVKHYRRTPVASF